MPDLQNKSLDHYKDRNSTRNTWEKVSTAFIFDFNE